MTQKVIWITGASSGIGEAVAKKYAQEGWSVAMSARSKDRLKDLDDMHPNLYSYPCDVTNADSVVSTLEKIKVKFGRIDACILGAGTFVPDYLSDWDLEAFNKQVDLNIKGTALCVHSLLPLFKKQGYGHFAIISSVAGYRGLPRSLGYGATKAALINFTEALKIETKRYGLKVQIINPGFVKTPLTDKNDFEMPFLIEVDEAASQIYKKMQKNIFEIAFPRVFVYILKFLGLLPDSLYFKIVGQATKEPQKEA